MYHLFAGIQRVQGISHNHRIVKFKGQDANSSATVCPTLKTWHSINALHVPDQKVNFFKAVHYYLQQNVF